MQWTILWLCAGALLLQSAAPVPAQQQPATVASSANPNAVVPPLVSFSGVVNDINNKPLTGVVGVTFALYKYQQGGAPLWLETQNVYPDKTGHYIVSLGSTSSTGLPSDIFVAGEARWLGVQLEGQAEQPRVLLLSVPYALKAGDAQTVGGLPASAFVLAAPSALGTTSTTRASEEPLVTGTTPVTTAGGTLNTLSLWDSSSDITSSVITQTGSGSTAKVGIITTTPTSTLDVKGATTVRGLLSLPAIGAATPATGKNSQAQKFQASVFNSGTSTAVTQSFQWQAEPLGNNTANPSGTLNLLYSAGTVPVRETGLKISSNGQIAFAAGQTFPGTGSGNGSVTSVGLTAPSTDFIVTGSPVTTSGMLGLGWITAPDYNNTPNTIVKRDGSGNFSAGTINAATTFNLGGNPFAFGSYANENAYFGFAGNATTTGGYNTANGYEALFSNTTGNWNIASGTHALHSNTTGYSNTATGGDALFFNTTGFINTATGGAALASNTIGSYNTATGGSALSSNDTGNQNTASGAYALALNKAGSSNTASGYDALYSSTMGGGNTASGYAAGYFNQTGSYNTFLGYFASPDQNSNNLTNATAIGANAIVSESNALVLGGTGSNAVNVGIGTATPGKTLDVVGDIRASGHLVGDGSLLTNIPAPTNVNCTGCITNTQLGVNYAGSGSKGGSATSALTAVSATTASNALALGGLAAGSFATIAGANTFNASQAINGNLSITGVGNGITFPDGTSLTSAAGSGVPVGYMIAGTSSVAPPGFTLSPAPPLLTSDFWAAAASMPTARAYLAAAADAQGNIYAIGGANSAGYLSTVEKYSPSTNTWTTVANMPTARGYLAAAADTQGNIYAIGGQKNNTGGYLSAVEKYSPSANTWTTMASMPTARTGVAAAVDVQGNIYAIGGYNGGYLSTVEKYSPSTNTWTPVASMSTARFAPAAVEDKQGNVYAIGGYSAGVPLSTVEKYSPSTNTWTTVASMPIATDYLAAATDAQGNIYAMGGYSGGYLSTVEKYSPFANTWITVANMLTARGGPAAADTQGTVYAIGGYNSGGWLSSVEKYSAGLRLYFFIKN